MIGARRLGGLPCGRFRASTLAGGIAFGLLAPPGLASAEGPPTAPVAPTSKVPKAAQAESERLASESELSPDVLRASLEIALALGGATLWYVIDERNVLDWDKPSLEGRFTGEAWRFDNNSFGINNVAHPLTGAGMYALARGNRIGPWGSFAASLVGSTFWEFVIEFNEKVSVNDMLVTPVAGIPIGEFFHKLATYVSSGPRGGLLPWTLGISVHGHRVWDSARAATPSAFDENGLSADVFHDFHFATSFGLVTFDDAPLAVGEARSSPLGRLAWGGRLATLDGYLRGDARATAFHEFEISDLALALEVSDRGFGYDLWAQTILAGAHTQSSFRRDSTAPRVAFTTGVATSYLLRSVRSGGFDDRQGLLLAPGLATDFRFEHGLVETRVDFVLAPVFGSITVPSFGPFRELHPELRTKTILEKAGYGYTFGFAVRAGASVRIDPIELRMRVLYGDHDSIEGLDRSQEAVEDDTDFSERVAELGFGLWIAPRTSPLRVGVSGETRRRTSSIGGGSTAPVRLDFGNSRVTFDVEYGF